MIHKAIVVPCRLCNTLYHVVVDIDGYNQWKNGMVIQKALPNLSAGDRELLISQTCNTCWKEMFKDDEDDLYDDPSDEQHLEQT